MRVLVSVGEALHHSGQTIKRPCDAASYQPAEPEAKRHHGDADRDDAGPGLCLRHRKMLGCFVRGIVRELYDVICTGQHVLVVDVDNGA